MRVPIKMARVNSGTFRDYSSVPSIALPRKLLDVRRCTFSGYADLRFVGVPSAMESLNGTFPSYDGLISSLIVPRKVASLTCRAFDNYEGVPSVRLPDALVSVNKSRGDDC